MKKLLVFVALLCFVAAGPAATVSSAKKESGNVNCCVKGQCKQMTKDDCKKSNGRVLKSCKDCK